MLCGGVLFPLRLPCSRRRLERRPTVPGWLDDSGVMKRYLDITREKIRVIKKVGKKETQRLGMKTDGADLLLL